MSLPTRYFSAGIVVTALVLAVACDTRINQPIAPTGSFDGTASGVSVNGTATIDICHRTASTAGFIPMSVPPTALEAHMQHGDARVGAPVPGQPEMRFAADCTAVAIVRAVITFRDLTTNRAPVSSYAEAGMTLVTTAASWHAITTYGNPAPSLQFDRAASAPTLTGEVRITAAGGRLFTFTSVDIYSSVTPIPYRFTGLLNSATVFTLERTQPNTFGNFATIVNPNPAALIDTLVIRLSNPATPTCPICSNPVGLDNVVVTR
jgi:hypothetical protein